MLVLVNKFVLTASPEEFEKVFTETAEFMLRQPGFLSYRLVRSDTDPAVYINIAEWTDRESLLSLKDRPEMIRHRAEIKTVAVPDPHFCSPVAEAEGIGRETPSVTR
jgi:long-chain acyl-CoA synthetase